jgi:hypothetical protein
MMKQAPLSSTDQGGAKWRSGIESGPWINLNSASLLGLSLSLDAYLKGVFDMVFQEFLNVRTERTPIFLGELSQLCF